jgi:hypothetical protein
MEGQRALVLLTFVNVALAAATTIAQVRAAAVPNEVAPVVRARALQIVDDEGRVRASIAVLPAKSEEGGARNAETDLLRLITERGRPSVKIAASEEGAGISFAGPTGTKETYVKLGASGNISSLTLKNEDGRERILTP